MIDYSNTIIYKLECKDPRVTDIYVGSTVNFKKRKSDHKRKCNEVDDHGEYVYDMPVYQFMRLNGGWDNWNMVQVDVVACENKRQKNKIESEYIKELGSTLSLTSMEGGLEMKEWYKQYREKNREKIATRMKQYQEDNREKIAHKNKEWRENNREKIYEKQKKWCEDNHDHLLASRREYYRKTREKTAKSLKRWRDKNRDMVKCVCGSTIVRYKIGTHENSKKHIEWIRMLKQIEEEIKKPSNIYD